LRKSGYTMLSASLGREGLISAWKDQPDIIILDPVLPDVPGLELVNRLRHHPKIPKRKVVNRAIDRIQLAGGRDGRFPLCLRPWSLEHHYFWRHRIWQDHVPKCAFWFYPGRGTNRYY